MATNEVIFTINYEGIKEMENIKPDHSDLIVEMTKEFIAANITSGTQLRIKDCIEAAELVIGQLKEKGYLK